MVKYSPSFWFQHPPDRFVDSVPQLGPLPPGTISKHTTLGVRQTSEKIGILVLLV